MNEAVAPNPPLAATLLAAGLGLRLGGVPKSALRIGDSAIMERIVAALRGAGLEQVSVVIGPYRDQLLPLIARCGARALEHHQDQPSLVESQRLALRAHAANFPDLDLLLVLADLPLLSAADVRHLIDHWHSRPPGVHALMPVVAGVRGHPLLLSGQAVKQLISTPSYLGIRDWLNGHADATWPLVCTQEGYVTDVDTEEDLLQIRSGLGHSVHPGRRA